MRKRLLRYMGALIVSLITAYSGSQRYAWGDAAGPCSLSDVAAWQVALDDPQEEATPAYRQAVTEAFLERCPERPEAEDAHRIAGMAAAWAGKVETAAAHFEKAGYISDSDVLLMHAAVRFALGDSGQAKQLRDEAIETWIARLIRLDMADIASEQTPAGELIRVRFRKTDPETQVSHIWVARPDGAAWPAALSVTSERQLNALFRLRAGEDAAALRYVRLYRCRSRKLLARTSQPLGESDMDAAARASLIAYMANPDRPSPGKLESCLFDSRILPAISRSASIPLQ